MTKLEKLTFSFLSYAIFGLLIALIQGCDTDAPVVRIATEDKHTEILPKDAEVRAVITVFQDNKHKLLFRIVDNKEKTFAICQYCPSEYIAEQYNITSKDKRDLHCDKLRDSHKKEGKIPICLTRSTLIGTTSLTIGQSVKNPDCMFIDVGGGKIAINQPCEH